MAELNPFKAAATWLLCMLALFLAPGLHAQTITNTANAYWTQSGKAYAAVSNSVAFGVSSTPATLQTFAISPSSATGSPLSFTPSQCGGAVLTVPGATGSSAQVASVAQASTVNIGDVFYFRLVAPQANTHPNVIDSITVELVTSGGDQETITAFETAPNSGVFIGAMPTTAIPPQPSQNDCRLSVAPSDTISILCLISGKVSPLATAIINVLADPYGLVFASADGTPVSGTAVTLINVATGAPAQVFAPDGVSSWPSTVTTGQTVTDSSGASYQLPAGGYRFPLVAPGQYRLAVVPPSPYTAPSTATAAQLAGILRPDGTPPLIDAASYGGTLIVPATGAVRADIPVDSPAVALALTKTASRASAQPGDVVFYTVVAKNGDTIHAKRGVTLVDTPARQLRLRTSSVQLNGAPAGSAVTVAPDGSTLTVQIGTIAPGASATITYAMTVSPNATAGQALNKAMTTDSFGLASYASAVVNILEDTLTARMTLIGQVTDGGCVAGGVHQGIAGVRVMLEDGTFAITDRDGRYHFDGLVPGDHVAQAMAATLPEGGQFLNCGRSTRNAGSAISRFVSGQGGSLAVADFYASLPKPQAADKPAGAKAEGDANTPPGTLSDRAAAGGETDWLTVGDGPTQFLFPTPDHNPRAPAVRVVIRHRAGQKVELSANGAPVAAVAFDGTKVSADHSYAVSIWRGIPLDADTTHLVAVVRGADGSTVTTLTRDVHFAHTPVSVQIVPQLTNLVADGRTRPVVALRVLDRDGHPVHAGLSGEIALSTPYESAEALDAMQSRALSGMGRSAPHWTVKGDDGIALVELAPTMVSGSLQLDFTFDDGQQKRHQTIESWVVPGNQKWTLVGLAEGYAGSRSIADVMERNGTFSSDLGDHARLAFYAKGRVLGKYLLTVAYDSAKQKLDQTLLGAIDPNAYYTVFADGSNRRFDAASRNKLYVRIESKAFNVVFGDFDTAFTQTQLARYQRTLTGVKAEATLGAVHLQGFGADVTSTHHRDEFQGGGVSGPYRLSSNAIVANSETVTLEVRDRFQSNIIVSSTTLTRFVDYDIDLLSGTITFKQPILSHDAELNPQFIIIDYDIDPVAGSGGSMVGGARTTWTSHSGKLRVGATAISDMGDTARTNMGALDVKAQLPRGTEIRAEAGVSNGQGQTSNAWLVEAEHHDARLDLLAYARSADANYGVGQTNGVELGHRKIGADSRLKVSPKISVNASIWYDESLTDGSHSVAMQVKAEYKSKLGTAHLGVATEADRLADGTAANSTVVEAGVTKKLLHNKLEVDATMSTGIGGTNAINLPATDALTLKYAVSHKLKLVGSYEIATGNAIDARTARIGFELTPWKGGRITSSLGDQDVAEYGQRSFAAFGLTQSYDVTHHLMVDASLDANKVLGGFNINDIVNAAQPVVTGGQLDGNGTLTENFTAVTLGASWHEKLWTVTARGELRNGELSDRRGLTFGAIRQLGDGEMVGAGFSWTHAAGSDSSTSAVFDSSLAAAYRPATSDVAFLTKLEFRSDTVTGAVANATGLVTSIAGIAGTATTALDVNGDARSSRLIGSFSADWSPKRRHDGEFTQRSEVNIFAAVRYNFDAFDGTNLAGTTLLGGLDASAGIGDRFEVGIRSTVRAVLSDQTTSFAYGPQIGFVPAENMLLTLGYNVAGFRDADFTALRTTNKGIFASLRMKFDASTFGFLGLGADSRNPR